MTRRLRGDAGQVAGIESIPFGLLVLVVGILLVAHTWAVVDAKFVATTAAREATRAYVEAADADVAVGSARRAAAEVARRSGRATTALDLDRGALAFGRCVRTRFDAGLRIPALGMPWRTDRPSVLVRGGHEAVVDPYRDGLPGSADCRTGS
jgi:hypothetical protein